MSLPAPELDDKSFTDLVEDAKVHIPVYAPEWTDHNVHDPGITFIELFAWLVEMQIYRLNRVTAKNKLKFLKLLGIKPKHATAACADVTFSFSDGYNRGVPVPRGAKVAAKDPKTGENMVFETDRDICVFPVRLDRVISQSSEGVRDNTDANELDNQIYHAFGEEAEAGSMLYLGFNHAFLPVTDSPIDLMVYLYETDLIPLGRHGDEEPDVTPSAEVRWEYLKNVGGNNREWVGLDVDRDKTLGFTYGGRISFKTPVAMAKWVMPSVEDDVNERYWIRCRVVRAGYEVVPRIDAIRLNTVPVTHGETVSDELSGTGQPDQTFDLQHKPVLPRTLVLSMPDKPWVAWEEVDDFDASRPEDPHYLIEHDAGRILFGDGVHGLIPPEAPERKKNIRVTYRCGGGENGNVKARAINQILDDGFETLTVTNGQDACGGAREETLEERIIRARKDLKERYRAVTSEDYEYVAKATPGLRVKRAKSIPEKEAGSVTVVVVPESRSDKPVKPSEGFILTVCRHLDKHRLITTMIHVRGPEYVKVSVNAAVKIKRGHESDTVRGGVENALTRFLHPITGGSDGDGWQFGRSVFKSEIYELIDGVDGVDCVQELYMTDGKSGYGGEKIEIPKWGLVYLGDYSIRIIGPDEECKVMEV